MVLNIVIIQRLTLSLFNTQSVEAVEHADCISAEE